MKIGRPERFGETSPLEREIITDIIFCREVRRQTFQNIADDLNSSSRWPRRAAKWEWGLVRHVYMCNRRPPGKPSKEGINAGQHP